MTNEQINIAIVEACGWKQVEGEECFFDNGTEQVYIENIPDYCNDLNAMHEAEKVLEEKRLVWKYEMTLTRNGGNGFNWSKIHATALQRAKAFLKTLGKCEGAK